MASPIRACAPFTLFTCNLAFPMSTTSSTLLIIWSKIGSFPLIEVEPLETNFRFTASASFLHFTSSVLIGMPHLSKSFNSSVTRPDPSVGSRKISILRGSLSNSNFLEALNFTNFSRTESSVLVVFFPSS